MTPMQQPPHIPGGFVPLQHQSSLHATASGLAGRPSSAVSPPLAMHRPASAPPTLPAASCLSPAPFEPLGGASHAAGSGFAASRARDRHAVGARQAAVAAAAANAALVLLRGEADDAARRRRSRPASPSPPRAPSRAATARAARRRRLVVRDAEPRAAAAAAADARSARLQHPPDDLARRRLSPGATPERTGIEPMSLTDTALLQLTQSLSTNLSLGGEGGGGGGGNGGGGGFGGPIGSKRSFADRD